MMGSAVAVPELLSAATSIAAEHGNYGVVMNAMLLTFLVLIFVVVGLLGRIERKLVEAQTH
jgi:polar amino acid transport system substrate-binding protein